VANQERYALPFLVLAEMLGFLAGVMVEQLPGMA